MKCIYFSNLTPYAFIMNTSTVVGERQKYRVTSSAMSLQLYKLI